MEREKYDRRQQEWKLKDEHRDDRERWLAEKHWMKNNVTKVQETLKLWHEEKLELLKKNWNEIVEVRKVFEEEKNMENDWYTRWLKEEQWLFVEDLQNEHWMHVKRLEDQLEDRTIIQDGLM